MPDECKRPPYRRSWREAGLRLLVTIALQAVFGVPVYLAFVVSDAVPNENPEYWRLRLLWWSGCVLVIMGLRCLVWVYDALFPSDPIPHA